MVGGNLDAFPSRGLSMNPSLQQVESDVQAPSIAEEDFLEDLRDPEVIKYEKSLLIDDVVINPKVFAAWARSFKQINLNEKTNEDLNADGEAEEEEQKTGKSYKKEEVMVKEKLEHVEAQQFLIVANEEKIYFFQKSEGQVLKLQCMHKLEDIELISVAQEDQLA